MQSLYMPVLATIAVKMSTITSKLAASKLLSLSSVNKCVLSTELTDYLKVLHW